MDENIDTDSLRKMAPQWSLAGDDQLIRILENVQEKLVAHCEDVQTKLNEMSALLDTASIKLQNVDNWFMAQSNTQFIESRVYEDDVDVATESPQRPQSQELPTHKKSELETLMQSLSALEAHHEALSVLPDSDSDEDSDSEEDHTARLVLKPKDMYSDRPLPYIIGSQAWRNKRHAGLLVEDSESESSESRASDLYSESEPEGAPPPDAPLPAQLTVSEAGSSLEAHSAAEVAARVARRLAEGAPPPAPPEPEPVAPPSKANTLYIPHRPPPSTIFSDEPPPVDRYESEGSTASDDDIFAELRRNQPYADNNRDRNRVADDILDFNKNQSAKVANVQGASQQSTLFEGESEPELFAPNPDKQLPNVNVGNIDNNPKKPLGGVSLFGATGTESIGAAILKRNQRKVSNSDESDTEAPQIKQPIKSVAKSVNKEKDILHDLFAKSEKDKKNEQKKDKKNEPKKEPETSQRIDIFSDNLFDDIDDIFTSNIVTKANEPDKSKKSLFDDDDDDLFKEVAVTKDVRKEFNDSVKKGLFDSDDDLFVDKGTTSAVKSVDKSSYKEEAVIARNETTVNKVNTSEKKSLFDSDDEILLDKSNSAIASSKENVGSSKETAVHKTNDNHKSLNVKRKSNDDKGLFDSDDELFTDNIKKKYSKNVEQKSDSARVNKQTVKKDIEEDNDDLFIDSNIIIKNERVESQEQATPSIATPPSVVNEISGREDKVISDSYDELFSSRHKEPPIFKESSKPQIKDKPINTKAIENKATNSEIDYKVKLASDTMLKENEAKSKLSRKEIFDSSEELFTNNSEKSAESRKNQVDNLVGSSIFINQVKNTNIIEQKNLKTSHIATQKNIVEKTEIEKTNKPLSGNDNFINVTPKNIVVEHDKPSSISDTSENEPQNKIIFAKPDLKEPVFNSPSLFDDDEEDDLFSDVNKVPKINDNLDSQIANSSNKIVSENSVLENDTDIEITNTNNKIDSLNSVHYDDEENSKNNSSVKTDKNNFIDTIETTENIFIEEPPPLIKNYLFSEDKATDLFPGANQKTDSDNKSIENENLSSPTQKSLKPDALSELFLEPPAFEKAKEPKKSKNVNALFDDDSDDEALFFKKNDIITDDKPEDFSSRDIFGIFHDEPPAIDFDFSVKSKHDEDTSNDIDSLKNAIKEDIMVNLKSEIKQEVPISKVDIKVNKSTVTEVKPDVHSKTALKDVDENKKVGKLKAMNFSINVNALLPGASPKKIIPQEQVDGQIMSVDVRNEVKNENITDKVKTQLVKSVSFEEDSESKVLDNKISKERAKIQVKRRPSTRRARKEAVRKSAIDFGEDSTDNSSSIDDAPKNPLTDIVFEPNNIRSNENIPKNEILNSDAKELISKPNRDVKSKIVYILNDEDIFDIKPEIQTDDKTIDNKNTSSKEVSINEKTHEVTHETFSSNVDRLESLKGATGISTLSNTYKEFNLNNPHNELLDEGNSGKSEPGNTNEDGKRIKSTEKPKSLFEDSDDELFTKNTKKITKTTNLFNSDSEDDLFGGKMSRKKDNKKEVVKDSLFGDDDDDDLFYVKSRKNYDPKPQASTSLAKDKKKSAKPVFEDPLSILGDDD